MRVVISNTAKAEIANLIDYIRKRNISAAREQRAIISRAVARLRGTPRIGRPGRVEGTRELVVGGTPFILIYEIIGDQLSIAHVLHGRQQWPREDDDNE